VVVVVGQQMSETVSKASQPAVTGTTGTLVFAPVTVHLPNSYAAKWVIASRHWRNKT
jgi:hypothetical protein